MHFLQAKRLVNAFRLSTRFQLPTNLWQTLLREAARPWPRSAPTPSAWKTDPEIRVEIPFQSIATATKPMLEEIPFFFFFFSRTTRTELPDTAAT